jgi:hypothetical protein
MLPESSSGNQNNSSSSSGSSSYNDDFLNCFVSFSQRPEEKDPNTLCFYREALVIVSHWPIPQLAFKLLSQLEETHFVNVINKKIESTNDDPTSMEEFGKFLKVSAENLTVVADENFSKWGIPSPHNLNINLPFMGEVLYYHIIFFFLYSMKFILIS